MPSKACESRRYLLRKDGMGFSFHETVLYANSRMFIQYKNHLEAVFITKGSGLIELVQKDTNGKELLQRYKLQPGTMYALDGHEAHYLSAAAENMHCVCVFTPPCAGLEAQRAEDGSFPFIGDDGIANYEYWAEKERKGEKILVELKPARYIK